MATTGIERIAQQARRQPEAPCTALMHHCTVGNLRACCMARDGTTAPGVDGITKTRYGEPLEDNLQGLHRKRHQMSYRPRPGRRVEMPKEDGRMRPLGIRGTEDQIVPELTRQILEAIDEPVFLDTSSGVRPERSCHDA